VTLKRVIPKQHPLGHSVYMLRPYSNLAPFFEIQVDVEALNYQVEERKFREAIERNKDIAYGKYSRLQQNQKEWPEVGQFCLRIEPEALRGDKTY
jgi:hypothetical protein